jgi:hypothetical protein
MSEKEQSNSYEYIERGYEPACEGYKPSIDNITIDSNEINPQGGYQPEENSGNNPANQPDAPGDE